MDTGCEAGVKRHAVTLPQAAQISQLGCGTLSETLRYSIKISAVSPLERKATLKTLFVGDVLRYAGQRIVREHLPHVIMERGADLLIINAENAAGGYGVTPAITDDLCDLGAHVLTTGN